LAIFYEQHVEIGQEAGYTAYIERSLNTFRKCLGRFVRKTMSISEFPVTDWIYLQLFLHLYNLEIAICRGLATTSAQSSAIYLLHSLFEQEGFAMVFELPRRVADNIVHFNGRAWLLPKILTWFEQSDQRLFLLTGGPGTGKSMVTAWLAGYGPAPINANAQDQLTRMRTVVGAGAVHFCQSASRNITPQAFAENVANQLTRSVPGFADALAATLAERVQIHPVVSIGTVEAGASVTGVVIGNINLGTLGDELSFDRAFTQPLKKLYAGGYALPLLVLVDALDEAQIYTGVKLPDLLARLDDLPPQVRILATTRPDPRVLKLYRNAELTDLIQDAPPDDDDVRQYVANRLSGIAVLSEVQRTQMAERISAKAQGIFLYAAIVLDDLLSRFPDVPDLEHYSLPDGLSGLYHAFLNRELGQDEDRWYEIYEPLLGLLAVSQGAGLTAAQLAALIGRDVRQALRACKQYLSGELPEGPFRPFHQSFVDFLLTEVNNLDYHIDRRAMHCRIADYYWTRHSADWSTCDHYGLQSLALHLSNAEQYERLTALITQQWMHARVAGDGYTYDGFVRDVMLAWQHAHDAACRQIEASETPYAIADCIRYALTRTSINAIAGSYPPVFVQRALETKLWSVDQGWSVAVRISDMQQRAVMYQCVLDTCGTLLTSKQHYQAVQESLAAVCNIRDEGAKAEALAALAPHLTGDLLVEGLAVARDIRDEGAKAKVLTALAPHRTGDLLVEGLTAIRSIKDDRARATALAALAPHLTGDLLVEGLAIARDIRDEGAKAEALAALAPHLTGDLLVEGLAVACSIADNRAQAQILIELAVQLDGVEHEQALCKALAAARSIADKKAKARVLISLVKQLRGIEQKSVLRYTLATLHIIGKEASLQYLTGRASFSKSERIRAEFDASSDNRFSAKALAALAPYLTGDLLVEGLAVARNIRDEGAKAKALAALAPYLTGDLLVEGLAVARTIRDEGAKAKVLTALAPYLTSDLLIEGLVTACTISDNGDRAQALVALVARLDGVEDEQALHRGLAVVYRIRDMTTREETLAALAPHLSDELLMAALTAGRTIRDECDRAHALIGLAKQLPSAEQERVSRDALAMVRAIRDEAERAWQLAHLAPHLGGTILAEGLTVIHTIESQRWRAEALTALAPQLSGELLSQGLVVARTIKDDWFRARVLVALAPCLSGDLLVNALGMARKITESELGQVQALSALAKQLHGIEKADALRDALKAARAIWSDGRASALVSLAPHLSGDLLMDALMMVRDITTDVPGRVDALVALAPHLTGVAQEQALHEALVAAQAIGNEETRARVLTDLVPHLTGVAQEQALHEALVAAQAIGNEETRARVLTDLVPHLTGVAQEQALREALSAAQAIGDEGTRADMLTYIAPHLTGVAQEQALREALAAARAIGDEGTRADMLTYIAAHLRDTDMRQFLIDELWSKQHEHRSAILCVISTMRLLEPPIMTEASIAAIARNITEIGAWEWV
jgi:hypothetical protein